MSETRIVAIDRLGAQGDGVAETSDGPEFVAGGLPGEQVEIEAIAGTGRSRPRILRIVSPSPERVAAPCRHFGVCGGCSAQHMSAALYRDWKRSVVVSAFAHRGLDIPVGALVAISPPSRRRVALEARRTAAGLAVGFHEAGSHALVDLQDCRIMRPAILAALPLIRQIASIVLANDASMRLVVTETEVGLDIAASGLGQAPDGRVRARLVAAAATPGIARLMIDGDVAMVRSRPVLRIGGADVEIPAGDFIQATAEAEVAMIAHLTAAIGTGKRVADLFAGVGTFTFPLARKARVLAVDSAPAAITALKEAAARTQGLKPVEALIRDLLHQPLSRKELEAFDAVAFDPPRAGAQAQAEALARSAVPVVAAVSCNPATLARDCRILVDGGYAIETVTPIDQFVWSHHVEVIAILRRPKPAARPRTSR